MTVFTLMTALPPTKGHIEMVKFASNVARFNSSTVKVIVHTQSGEPYIYERFNSLHEASLLMENVTVLPFHQDTDENPDSPGFREYWRGVMLDFGFSGGDILVTSESYGNWLAEICGGVHMPFDPERSLFDCKATRIREENGLIKYFDHILPEFQHRLKSTITVFGTESVGKTTFSKELAVMAGGHWLYEYARPYLETVGNDITVDAMKNIWIGQKAAQESANQWKDKPFVIQDTDLFSTVGYWGLPHWRETLGEVPRELINDAITLKSDLYIILSSNIPFEEDALRYGGDARESDDQYWIDLCERYELDYVVIEESDPILRIGKGLLLTRGGLQSMQDSITYDRGGC